MLLVPLQLLVGSAHQELAMEKIRVSARTGASLQARSWLLARCAGAQGSSTHSSGYIQAVTHLVHTSAVTRFVNLVTAHGLGTSSSLLM
jgi:hypothetical protein